MLKVNDQEVQRWDIRWEDKDTSHMSLDLSHIIQEVHLHPCPEGIQPGAWAAQRFIAIWAWREFIDTVGWAEHTNDWDWWIHVITKEGLSWEFDCGSDIVSAWAEGVNYKTSQEASFDSSIHVLDVEWPIERFTVDYAGYTLIHDNQTKEVMEEEPNTMMSFALADVATIRIGYET